MTSASPTVLAIEGDSAWIVILAVSTVTLLAVLFLRRLIRRPGGLASGLLLILPLLLPLIAAVSFDHAALPVVAVLRPVNQSLLDGSRDLLHVLFLANDKNVVTAYALSETAGAWMLWIGLSVSSLMLIRRAIGTMLVRRLIHRSRPLGSGDEGDVRMMVEMLTDRSRLSKVPAVLVMPPGNSGAFAVAGKGGRILISPELLSELDRAELEGILAHEIAHLEARDVQVAFSAGFMRDLVAWNPVAHIAYRRLLADREVEADRRAVGLTGDPLSVASGLVRLCELRKGRRGRMDVVLAFGGGRVPARVSNLLALADGSAVMRAGGALPYMFAALLVAVLGLQAGAQISSGDAGAYAIVLGSAEEPADGTYWSPGDVQKANHMTKEERLQKGVIMARREPTDPIAFKAKFKNDWIKQWKHKVRRAGLDHEIQLWDLQKVNIITGSIGFYRLAPGAI
ncbi:MAG: heat shock protein HtpX [Actinomycetota bacterium]|nr:heat shock protein HtpX [Actinomycetota bacterium]